MGDKEHIEAAVEYNIEAVSDEIIDSGEYSVVFTMRLLQKQDSGEYNAVDLHQYLDNFELRGKDGSNILIVSDRTENGYQFTFNMSSSKNTWEFYYSPKVISGIVAFDAKTGSDWLENVNGSHYGNYKIEMKAQIIKTADSTPYGNVATGEIVYTNAKMNAQFVSKKAG
ncbi:hypothetical protein [Ruminococcus flavefaciens]|uniref:hypothetical protein n=1 Tax=Ruminococcus flavefaciens TaxID=1265 RepID=UPI0026EF0968|nr:hypothetical protein [Ruminococcus flavefaciens]